MLNIQAVPIIVPYKLSGESQFLPVLTHGQTRVLIKDSVRSLLFLHNVPALSGFTLESYRGQYEDMYYNDIYDNSIIRCLK